MASRGVAILPEEMSEERFRWLDKWVADPSDVVKTPGCESNVKEIFDKCWELRESGQDLVIFNQFEEFGNYLWHWAVTGAAVERWLADNSGSNARRGSSTWRGRLSRSCPMWRFP